jgi:hypothetical protein
MARQAVLLLGQFCAGEGGSADDQQAEGRDCVDGGIGSERCCNMAF